MGKPKTRKVFANKSGTRRELVKEEFSLFRNIFGRFNIVKTADFFIVMLKATYIIYLVPLLILDVLNAIISNLSLIGLFFDTTEEIKMRRKITFHIIAFISATGLYFLFYFVLKKYNN